MLKVKRILILNKRLHIAGLERIHPPPRPHPLGFWGLNCTIFPGWYFPKSFSDSTFWAGQCLRFTGSIFGALHFMPPILAHGCHIWFTIYTLITSTAEWSASLVHCPFPSVESLRHVAKSSETQLSKLNSPASPDFFLSCMLLSLAEVALQWGRLRHETWLSPLHLPSAMPSLPAGPAYYKAFTPQHCQEPLDWFS